MIERQADEIARLRDESAKLRADQEECDALRRKLTDILTRTANALKGEPAPLTLHSWHDLPEWAQRLRDENAGMRKDAGRYRWLRSKNVGPATLERVSDDCNPPYFTLKCGEDLDAGIDAVMTAMQKGE